MNFECKIDNSIHSSLDNLHKYLRKLHVKKSDYYMEFFPKKDLLTEELIPFTDYNKYFSQDFLNKRNLNKWLKTNPEKGKEWAIGWLKKRKEAKGLVRAPSDIELISLSGPSIKYFNEIGDYNKICEDIGLVTRFNYKSIIEYQFEKFSKVTVLCDTREKKLIKFKNANIEIQKLDYGDYKIENKFDTGIFIEKKSISDFAQSFGKSINRLEREIIRCNDNKHYLVILVLANYHDALNFNYLPQMKWTKANPDYVFHNVRFLLEKYENLQFLFVENYDIERTILNLFRLGNNLKKIDLQYKYNLQEI